VELCEQSLVTDCDDGTMKPDHGIKVFTEHMRDAMRKWVDHGQILHS
jgi:hypothetical protein